MPFNIGNIFSPQILSMVESEKDRNLQRLRLQADLYEGHKQDKFRRSQLAASERSDNADRASRERMARESNDTRIELGDMANQLRSSQIDAREAQSNAALAEKARQFDAMYPLKEQDAEARTTRADAASRNATARGDEVALKRQVEFGSGDPDNPTPGSKASGRRVMEGKGLAQTEFVRARIEELTRKLEGSLPADIDRKERTRILGEHQALLERSFRVKSANEAKSLAVDLVKALRNPLTGAFNDPNMARTVSELSGSVFGTLQSFSDEFSSAFADAFQEESNKAIGEDNDKTAKTRKDADPAPMPTGDDSARKAMEAMERMREAARKRAAGEAPNPTGR